MHEREVKSRVNYFDGQRVTEQDLRDDQTYVRDSVSGNVHDSGNFGVIDRKSESEYTLLDLNNMSNENLSYDYVQFGKYDGKIIYLDKQPSNKLYGNRLEVSVLGSNTMGRFSSKVIIVGWKYNSLSDSGSICYEVLDFKENGTLLTKNYYLNVFGISINNYSGGTLTSGRGSFESNININPKSEIIIREARPLRVFSDTVNFEQVMVPSHDAHLFGTKYDSFDEFLTAILSSNRSKEEVYYNFLYEYEELSSSSNISDSVGQKFLSANNNIQSVDVMLSSASSGNWSGDIVFSIYKLSSSSSSRVAHDPISFDPESRPIAQVALDQQDLADRGVFLSTSPEVISIDFSRFECANPSSGKIGKNEFYAFDIRRVGDIRENSIRIYKGDYIPAGKSAANIALDPQEKFSKQNYKLYKFDGNNEKYLDYSSESLWISVKTSAIEVTPGSAYSSDGFYLNIPYSKDYVGDTKVLNYKGKIDIPKFNEKLYVVLTRSEKFSSLDVHPRTGDFVHTRIADSLEIEFLSPPADINENLILASVTDNNERFKSIISGKFSHAGLYDTNFFYIIRPSESEKSLNYIGKNFIPDTDCQCNNEYQIIRSELSSYRMGDLNLDGKYSLEDSEIISSLSGNTLNSQITERKMFGGEFDIVDFYLADLNNDGAIDGFDILKSEDAARGFVDFEAGNSLEVLKVYFQNLKDEYSLPLFEGSATTTSSSNKITFVAGQEARALSIRIDDIVNITSSEEDGKLFVKGKEIAADQVTVTLYLKREDGTEPAFIGTSASISVLSKTQTNIFADNENLISTPYSQKSYKIYTDETEFKKVNIDICDLRTNIVYSRRKKYDSSCECVGEHVCEKAAVVETVMKGDLKIHGKILGGDDYPYRGDIEFANIKIPLPAGSIDGCSIDLYENFIKSSSNSCFTSNGLPALRYSDNTYVGCEDVDGNTDIDKNRVKFMYGIASLFVETDKENASLAAPNTTLNSSAVDYFVEDYEEKDYSNLFSFSKSVSSNGICEIITGEVENPVNLEITSDSADQYAIAIGESTLLLENDFTLDIEALRTFSGSLSFGDVKMYAEVRIKNDDGTSGTFKIGYWTDSVGTSLFSEITNFDSGLNVTESKIIKVPLSETIGDVTNLRLRRVDDSIKGYFFIDDDLSEESVLGVYKRIDENPLKQIGFGEGSFRIVMESIATSSGSLLSGSFRNLYIENNYDYIQTEDSITLSRDASDIVKKLTFNFPLSISSNVIDTISTAKLIVTPNETNSGSFPVSITGSKLVNARNFDSANNYFDAKGFDYIGSITNPVAGEAQEIDIKQGIKRFLNLRNFLSGSYRSMSIAIKEGNSKSIQIKSNLSIEITYNNLNQNITYKVGLDMDTSTGIMTIRTKNILFDSMVKENRTVVSVGVLLKKSGFLNGDVEIDVESIKNIGLGNCISVEDGEAALEIAYCNTIAGYAMPGIVVGAPDGYECGESGSKSSEVGAQLIRYEEA